MKEIKFDVPQENAQEFAKEMIALADKYNVNVEGIDSLLPITERVKTYEDACRVLGFEPVDFNKMRYSSPVDVIKSTVDVRRYFLEKDEVAYIKLKTIAAALNEGWIPEFTNEEYRYYPWFTFWTKEELAEKSEEWKKERSVWLFGGRSVSGAYCGLACAGSNFAWSRSTSRISARLAVKSEELAIYFGKQFIGIWADYVGPFGRLCRAIRKVKLKT